MKSIKLYTDIHLLKDNRLNMNLFPLIDCLMTQSNLESNSDFEFIEDQEHCDVFLFPISIEHMFDLGEEKVVLTFIEKAKSFNKKVLVFTSGDIGLTLNHDHVLILRLGGFNSKMSDETFIMPPFIEDPYLKIKNKFLPIEKPEKPNIGFVGHANGGVVKLIKEFLIFFKVNFLRILKMKHIDYQSFYPSSLFRYKYLSFLEADKSVITDFVYRNKYRAGAKTVKELETTTLEFYQNINLNSYTFCMRGAGNFSVRFYETLAMGRIPVLIDTDCKLPFSNIIDWKKHCLIVPKKDIANIGKYLCHFHQEFSSENFKQVQESNRLLWETHFTKYIFFIQLKNELIKRFK